MPYISPVTCTACVNGNGYDAEGKICTTCFGGGVTPVWGILQHAIREAYQAKVKIGEVETKTDALDDRISDILDKVNDIIAEQASQRTDLTTALTNIWNKVKDL